MKHDRTGHRLRPRKRWGQNFLQDGNVIRNLVRSIGLGPDDHVVEIGPGRGALTPLLCERANSVTAVEIDPELVSFLTTRFAHLSNLTVLHQDFLKVDIRQLVQSGDRGLTVVGNIPYNVSTPILFKLLDWAPRVLTATLTVQSEVADRSHNAGNTASNP